MPAHHRVRTWIVHNYKKPAIDQEWLADCSDWLTSELGLDPDRDFDQFIQHVEAQLLQSNLADSTVPGSGIDPLLVTSNPNPTRSHPSNVRGPGRQALQKKTTGPTPLLVEIKSITEIAHSAFSLLNTHQTRLDRADLGLAREVNVEQHHDEDEGPVPRFPRGMLKFELSDGLTTFRAIEFRSLPQLELDTTPLGYKIILKSTPIRNGIAFLEPENVTLKGYRTEDHDMNREQVLLSSLRKRLGRPDPPPEEPVAAQPAVNLPLQPMPVQPAHQDHPPPRARPPSLPAGIDGMYVDDDVDPDVLREMTIQMDEAIDMQARRRVGAPAPPPAKIPSTSEDKHTANLDSKQDLRLNTTRTSTSLGTPSNLSMVKTSPYFTSLSSESKAIPDIGLSPRPAPPSNLEFECDIPWDIDEPAPSKLPVRMLGPISTEPSSTVLVKPIVSPKQRPSSPDSYHDLSFDMDMDESFLEQVGMIEEGALSTGANSKGKGNGQDIGTESTDRSSPAAGRKTPSVVRLGTTDLASCPVSPSGTECSTRMQKGTERAPSASSLSGSTESFVPHSTQSSDQRLPRDPSLIIISSEDEPQRGRGTAKPLDFVRKRTNKGRRVDQAELTNLDVIDISD